MTSLVMEPPTVQPKRTLSTERSVEEIIRRGRSRRPSMRGVWGLGALSAALMWCSFTPLDWGFLAWIALVPLMQVIRLKTRTAWMYTAIYVAGAAYWLPTLQWMRLGDPSMYVAWGALSLYLACYWPVFVWLSRVGVHRLRMPLYVATPVVWVGLEYVRGYMLSGFSWYLLAHSQYRFATLIQISDLCGGYLLSGLVVFCSATLALVIPTRFWQKLRMLSVTSGDAGTESWIAPTTSKQVLIAVVSSCVLFLASVGYGRMRLAQADFEAGPRVGLIQGNFRARVKSEPNEWEEIFSTHRYLNTVANSFHPDLVVWPESMYRVPYFEVDGDLSDTQLRSVAPGIPEERWRENASSADLFTLAEESRANLIIGMSWLTARRDGLDHFNSAVLVDPAQGVLGHYDKIHLVPFGEYVPMQNAIPWLSDFTPYGYGFGLTPGDHVEVFKVKDWNLVPLICFEDTVPHLVRGMVATAQETIGGDVDCIVNLTNDGWFVGSHESEQHLITAQFRCVETRTPMARAVNTGISAVIDGDGLIREPESFIEMERFETGEPQPTTMRDPETGDYWKEVNASIVVDVPLDRRSSLYVWWGDWFAAMCLAACCFIAICELVSRFKRRNAASVASAVT